MNSGGSSLDRYFRCYGGVARWSKKFLKIVVELIEMKVREKVFSLLVLSESVFIFINYDDDDVVVEIFFKVFFVVITLFIIVLEFYVY